MTVTWLGKSLVVTNHYSLQEKEAIVKLDLATRDLRCLQIPTGRQRHRVTRHHGVRQATAFLCR